jgi:anti-sigma regulatory factor (Ser/Thr protein kinase)
VPCARAHAVALLWEWQLASMSDGAELIVSELVTNAIVHASRTVPGGPHPVQLWLASDRRELLIMVADVSPRMPGATPPADDRDGGRGLLLVEAISKNWGCYPAANGGKVVWAILAP